MQPTCDIALKEWAAVNDLLREGRLCVLLRKGGIVEPRGGFEIERREFFIFPTRAHQNAGALRDETKSSMHASGGAAEAAEPGEIALDVFAEAVGAWRVTELERLRAVEPLQALNWDEIEKRFNYRGKPLLQALLLKAYRLPKPHRIVNTPEYEGCRSWVPLDVALSTAGAEPAMAAEAFEAAAARLREALAGCEAT